MFLFFCFILVSVNLSLKLFELSHFNSDNTLLTYSEPHNKQLQKSNLCYFEKNKSQKLINFTEANT